MIKERIKEELISIVDMLEERDLEELANYLDGKSESESFAEHLLLVNGELKKLTMTLNRTLESIESKDSEIESKANSAKLSSYLEFYSFLESSKEALFALKPPGVFSISRFKESFAAFKSGFLSIDKLYEMILKKEGIEILARVGGDFDPNYHEALEVIESREYRDGEIVSVIEQGFMHNDELINYAKVKVNKWKQ